MKRILTSDFYRLFRSFIFYSVPAILTVSLVITIIGAGADNTQASLEEIFSSATSILSSIIFLLADIVAVIIWSEERRHGYIKNLAGVVRGRHILTCSKMITGVVIGAVFTVFSLIYIFLSYVCCGVKITDYSTNGALVEFLLVILTGIATIALMLLLYELFHSSAICYIAAIMIWTGMLETLIVQLTYLAFKWENTGRYLLKTGLQWENSGSLEDLVRIIIYLVLFIGGAVLVSRKQDIKS